MKVIESELLALDTKDQKILAQLFRDGRASYSELARSAGVSKDVAQYRIDQLIKTGVMTNVNTIVDATKFGWQSALIFFNLTNLDKEKIKGFINYLVQSPMVVEVLELAGGFDFAARFYHKNIEHLNKIITELESKFPDLIGDYQTFFISKNIFLPYNILFEKYAFTFSEGKKENCRPDKLDFKILSAISFDGRKPLVQLENELHENRMTIYNRIKKMLQARIILHFRPNLFTEKLGFHWYFIGAKLNGRSEQKIKSIVNELKDSSAVHLVMPGFGYFDIVFYVQLKTVQDLQKVLYTIREEFSRDIKSIESASVIKDYKWDFFPKGFAEAFKNQKGLVVT